MARIEDLIRTEDEHTALQLRPTQYGRLEYDRFLQDVLAMANAEVRGARIIILGAGSDPVRGRIATGFRREELDSLRVYKQLARTHIEPPIDLQCRVYQVDERWFGVLLLDECSDPPYVLKHDLPPALKAGDGWIRHGTAQRRLLRRDLDRFYARKRERPVLSARVDIGFRGTELSQSIDIPTLADYQPPSAAASARLRTIIEARELLERNRQLVSTAIMRLTHVRVFGDDVNYESRSLERLRRDLESVSAQYREKDLYYRYEKLGRRINLTAVNRSAEPIIDGSVTLVLPEGTGIEVAPAIFENRLVSVEKAAAPAALCGHAAYPTVGASGGFIRITASVGELSCNAPTDLFREPLRIVATESAIGRTIPLELTLSGRNLAEPVVTRLAIKGIAPVADETGTVGAARNSTTLQRAQARSS